MSHVRGKVINQRVVVDEALPEGSIVTVELESKTQLSPEDEAELISRLEEARRGDVIEYQTIDEMMADLCADEDPIHAQS